MEACVVLHRTWQDEQGSINCREESKGMGEGERNISWVSWCWCDIWGRCGQEKTRKVGRVGGVS